MITMNLKSQQRFDPLGGKSVLEVNPSLSLHPLCFEPQYVLAMKLTYHLLF